MTRISTIGLALAVALCAGCALTDYGLITDNDQVARAGSTGVVNTNGKALVLLKSFYAVSYPDGTDELFSMVDQKANGDRTLTTYNNFSTGDDPVFRDDLYCNPDWQGCALFTAPDPEEGDVDPFDGVLNANCSGARSLVFNFTTPREWYGECGRGRLSLTDRLALLNMGRLARKFGREALLYDLNRGNTRVTLDNNAGSTVDVPLSGRAAFAAMAGARSITHVDATHPLIRDVLFRVADFLDDHRTERTTVTLTYNGISQSFDIGGEPFSASRVREFAQRKY